MRSVLSTLIIASAAALSVGAAFTSTLGPAAQCQDLSLVWSGEAGSLGPPFSLTILPFKSVPIVIPIPDSSFNASTNSGSYTISQLPIKAYTQFIAVMDDGFGRGTGGVSSILTVGGSSQSSCLGGVNSNAPGLFTLSGAPQQCGILSIALSSSVSSPTIRGFIPSGSAFSLDPPAAGATTIDWTVNVAAGTQIVLFLAGSGSGQLETSDLLTVGASPSGDASCIGGAGPVSTGAGTAPAASGTTITSGTGTGTGTTVTTGVPTAGTTLSTGLTDSLTRTGLTVAGASGTGKTTGPSKVTVTTDLPQATLPSGANAQAVINFAAIVLPMVLSLCLV